MLRAHIVLFSTLLIIRAIIGEASNQGYEGMLAVACTIRNRGTLQGVYGVSAPHVDNEPEWVWDMARRAWQESKIVDVTNGATHWGNQSDIDNNFFYSKLIKCYTYKDHVFYKEKGR